jgi:hypothetical protein
MDIYVLLLVFEVLESQFMEKKTIFLFPFGDEIL